MIDPHHLAYGGVLLVFLTGAAIVALAFFAFLSTGVLAVLACRIIKRFALGRLPGGAAVRRNAVEPVMPMEEALRQVAAGKAASSQKRTGNRQGNMAPIRPMARSRRPHPHWPGVTERSRHRTTALARTAA